MEFEWDRAKAENNLAKHGIDFDEAVAVFDDMRALSIVDPRSLGETRYQVIGTVQGRIRFVAYTMRDSEVCRIISARRVSRRERAAYSLPARS